MSFRTELEAILGEAGDKYDIRVMVRRCWFLDFDGYPVRIWEGQGKLHTTDDNTWLGTVDGKGESAFWRPPRVADGRDGTSPTYEFAFGYLDEESYREVRKQQSRVAGRPMTCWHALWIPGQKEGLRPQTPIRFHYEMTMFSVTFNEEIAFDGTTILRRYSLTITAKDGNFGRAEAPGRTYADTVQKRYAREMGAGLDRGAEFLAGLANRTYKVP